MSKIKSISNHLKTSFRNWLQSNSLTKYSLIVFLLLALSVFVLKSTTNVFADEDTEPPTTPAILLIAGTTPNSVTLTWSASTDNVGVEGYRIYRNGMSTIDVGITLHTFYNLPAGTHAFQVRAFDAAENVSGYSNTVVYLSIGTTGPTPTPTNTPTPTPTNTPTPTFTPTPTNTPTPTPTPVLTVENFSPNKDVYVRSGSANDNEGLNNDLVVQRTGKSRSIIDFGTAPFANLNVESSSDIVSAVLKVNITNNSNNWGTGRDIDVHAVTQNWVEGNGNGGNKGTGSGATWNCAIDSDISNSSSNCSGAADWDMNNPSGIWQSTPSDSTTIVNSQSGVMELDVTNDVKAIVDGTTYYGWILKLANEGQNGGITFGSRESTNPPEITITYWQ